MKKSVQTKLIICALESNQNEEGLYVLDLVKITSINIKTLANTLKDLKRIGIIRECKKDYWKLL